MDLFSNDIMAKVDEICEQIKLMKLEDQIETLNQIKEKLHGVSPFSKEPVDCVTWIKSERVVPNDYNPNKVAPPEKKLLKHSIQMDGFTQPVVTYAANAANEQQIIVDGEHRSITGKSAGICGRIHGYLPVTTVNQTHTDKSDKKDLMASTIRHNRARGVHGVIPMKDIVAAMIQKGWSDDRVATELGMDADEVLRFKQNSGLPELFKDHEYSRAWE